MKSFLVVTVTLLLMVPELLAGNLGLALGLPLFGAVFFSVAFGEVYGVSAAGFSALAADIMYDRPYPYWSIAAVIILYAAVGMVKRTQRKQPAASLAAGGVCGILIAFYNIFVPYFCGGTQPGPHPCSMFVFHFAGGIVFMFLLVLLFDAVNLRSNLPRFGVYESRGNLRGAR